MAERTSQSTVDVSIVIVNYNGAGFVEDAVASAFSAGSRLREVLLIDNGSTDASPDRVAREFPQTRIIRLARNEGFSGGANIGYRAATATVVGFVNSDAILPPGWADIVAAEFETDPHLACVTTTIRNEGEPPDISRGATYNIFGTRIPFAWGDDSRVWGPSGAAFALHKGRFPLSAPFPHHFFAYFEDFILGSALRHRRLGVRKLPSVIVYHGKSRTASRMSPNRLRFLQERNRVASLLATYSLGTLIKLLPLYVADLLLRMGHCLLRGGLFGFIIAHIHLTFSVLTNFRLRRAIRGSSPVPDTELLPFLSGKLLPHPSPLNSLSLMYLRLAGLPVAELTDIGRQAAP
jgi:GT2 family glycosyltransferase